MIVHLTIIHSIDWKNQDMIVQSITRIVAMIRQVHHLSQEDSLRVTYIATPFRKKIHWYQPRPLINKILAQDHVIYNRS